jgi:hypothetical protein
MQASLDTETRMNTLQRQGHEENIRRIGDRGEKDTETGLDTWLAVSMNRIKNKTGSGKESGVRNK